MRRRLAIFDPFVIRSDSEPALMIALEKMANPRAAEEIIRVHKLSLDTRIGISIPIISSVRSWLVEHGVGVTNTILIMHDGTSAYGRASDASS